MRTVRLLPALIGLLVLALSAPACGAEPEDVPTATGGSPSSSSSPSVTSARTSVSARSDGMPTKAEWLDDVAAAMHGSRAYLGRRVARGGGKLAIVLDIDNTSIASYYAWPKPVRPVRRFAGKAHRLGVTIFIVTGRRASHLGRAPRALTRAGYHYKSICTRRDGETLRHGKLRCRKRIQRHGYTIVANVGNRSTDFWHGHFERKYKLPDYGNRLA